MIKLSHLAAIAASAILATAQSNADQTNVVQTLRIELFGFSQNEPSPTSFSSYFSSGASFVRIDTRRVIDTLGAATTNAFSNRSRLVIVTPVDGGFSSIQVRDGSNTVDVTDLFAFESLSDSVVSSFNNGRSGKFLAIEYSIRRLALLDSEFYPPLNLHFDVNGFATQRTSRRGSELDINVSGTGDREGVLIILQGSIEVRGQSLEVVPDDGGGIGVT